MFKFYQVLSSFIKFYQVLSSFIKFYQVLSSLTSMLVCNLKNSFIEFLSQREKPSSKAQTCGLLQRISRWLLHCIKSELVLNWFSHYLNSYIFFISSFLRRQESCPIFTRTSLDSKFSRGNDRVWLFLPQLSFPHQLSFPRKRESRMLLSSDFKEG